MLNKFVVATVAAVVAVQAADAATCTTAVPAYLPLENPGEAKCIVKGEQNKDDGYFALKLAKCTDKNVVEFRHVGKNKEVRTSDRYCLDTKTSSSKAGTELVLRKCPNKCTANGLKWTKVGENQWENGNGLCADYDTKAKKFVQRECEVLEDDEESMQQWVFKQPPMVACASWGKQWVCGDGWALDTTNGLTCVGATDASCASVCCKPVTTCKSAGFVNKCSVNYKFVEHQCGNPGQKPCSTETCCEYVPPKTCKSEGYERTCGVDFKFVNTECGNAGQKPCSRDVCCKYDPQAIKCNQWNRCNNGFQLKPRAADIFCVRGKPVEGPSYAPTCSNDICCDAKPVVPEYVASTCGAWNQCNANYELVSAPFNRKCYVPNTGSPSSTVSGMCTNDYCCLYKAPVVAATCAQWTGSCNANAGKALVAKPETVQGSSEAACCVQDTCKNWGESIVKKVTAETGKQVCESGPSFTALVDKNDPRFETPCVDAVTGAFATCEASMCCV